MTRHPASDSLLADTLSMLRGQGQTQPPTRATLPDCERHCDVLRPDASCLAEGTVGDAQHIPVKKQNTAMIVKFQTFPHITSTLRAEVQPAAPRCLPRARRLPGIAIHAALRSAPRVTLTMDAPRTCTRVLRCVCGVWAAQIADGVRGASRTLHFPPQEAGGGVAVEWWWWWWSGGDALASMAAAPPPPPRRQEELTNMAASSESPRL
ncbi:hypothetical protein O3P69_004386 [Scylla paramamosain]|uniref:Uncharacterized protein n=1 Tax=Scylla paramamosain TaxID=85552 RepID=A0AAW0UEC4_SCYPA